MSYVAVRNLPKLNRKDARLQTDLLLVFSLININLLSCTNTQITRRKYKQGGRPRWSPSGALKLLNQFTEVLTKQLCEINFYIILSSLKN